VRGIRAKIRSDGQTVTLRSWLPHSFICFATTAGPIVS
jgi:hypothetical protein